MISVKVPPRFERPLHPKRVANFWTKPAARRRHAMITNGKEPENPNKLVVAATFEMQKLSFLPNL